MPMCDCEDENEVSISYTSGSAKCEDLWADEAVVV